MEGLLEAIIEYIYHSGFSLILDKPGNAVMMLVGFVFIYLGIGKKFEPLLLVPIGFGIVLGNMPFAPGSGVGIYEGPVFKDSQMVSDGSVLWYLYQGVARGIYPLGIFLTLLMAVLLGSAFPQLGLSDPSDPARLIQTAASMGIIGGADGPTAIFITTRMSPDLLDASAISAYSYMALVPVIQPPIMRLLTTKEERLIRMPPPKVATRFQRIVFLIVGLVVCVFIAPDALPLLGMIFFGNLLKESGVTERLAQTARNSFIDSVTILLGVTVGASTQADVFLKPQSIVIFLMGAFSFAAATAAGVLFAKFMNLFLKEKINPLLGSAGVSAVPHAARVSQVVAHREDPQNFLIMHAMAPRM